MSITIDYSEIEMGFDYVSSVSQYSSQAFLNKETGKIYWHSDEGENFEELPEDIEDEKYVEIPHKNELDLGNRLVFNFTLQYMPEQYDDVRDYFRRKGAYGRFADLTERKGLKEEWFAFEAETTKKNSRNGVQRMGFCYKKSPEIEIYLDHTSRQLSRKRLLALLTFFFVMHDILNFFA